MTPKRKPNPDPSDELEPSEADLARFLERGLSLMGIRWYHTHDSRRSVAGFPDYVIVLPSGVLFLELKRKGGSLSPAQVVWIAELTRVGSSCVVAAGMRGTERALAAIDRTKREAEPRRSSAVYTFGSPAVRALRAIPGVELVEDVRPDS